MFFFYEVPIKNSVSSSFVFNTILPFLGDNKVMCISKPQAPLRFNDTHFNHAQLTNNNDNNTSSISFDYKLGCVKYWYGPMCIKQCIPKDTYTCSAKGERICERGFYGQYCDSIYLFTFFSQFVYISFLNSLYFIMYCNILLKVKD